MLCCPVRLSAVVGVTSLPYGDLFDELMGGMFELHWDTEMEAFFDHGTHVSDGELTDEVIMRCQKGATSSIYSRTSSSSWGMRYYLSAEMMPVQGVSINECKIEAHSCPSPCLTFLESAPRFSCVSNQRLLFFIFYSLPFWNTPSVSCDSPSSINYLLLIGRLFRVLFL